MKNVSGKLSSLPLLTIALCLTYLLNPACSAGEGTGKSQPGSSPGGTLTVFHAGSLSVPFREMKYAFQKKYPGITVNLEASGSRTCARKITDLGKPCDVMASADYTVINNLLIPDFASWNIMFATNEMAIMYTRDSFLADRITSDNWHEILLTKGVEYGHSDPDSDPCGYRTLMVWQLAEKYYRRPGLYKELAEHCPLRNIRPKETDLIALLEAGELDYIFIYKSICAQHNASCITLPDNINLKNRRYSNFYKKASVRITGKRPGEYITKQGKPMIYGITVCRNAPNRRAAELFVAFVIGEEGKKILRKNGQPPVSPPLATGNIEKMPPILKKHVRACQRL